MVINQGTTEFSPNWLSTEHFNVFQLIVLVLCDAKSMNAGLYVDIIEPSIIKQFSLCFKVA